VDSSLWEESGDVVKVFMTMIATKNSDHVCELDAYKIARKCNFMLPDGSVDELKVLDILKVLASPDTRRKVKQEFDGRRIRAVEGGWFVLNGEKYRRMVQTEMKKARWRKAQAAARERKSRLKNPGDCKESFAQLAAAGQKYGAEHPNDERTYELPQSDEAQGE